MGPASAGFEKIKIPINSFSREKQGVSESTYNCSRDLVLAFIVIIARYSHHQSRSGTDFLGQHQAGSPLRIM